MDTHGSDVIDPVWQLLDKAYEHFGVMPTLLERDFNIPPVNELLAEVAQIKEMQIKKIQKNREYSNSIGNGESEGASLI